MTFEYTENISGGNFSNAQRVATAKADAQAIADSKGEPVTGTYILSDGERFTYTAYPAGKIEPKQPEPASESKGQVYSQDTVAYIQRGILQQPGYYGSQELSESNEAFNSAVGIATAAAGFASLLKKNAKPPSTYVRTSRNYILTEKEKETITKTSKRLANYGVVPYDTLENFFYILAAIENINDFIAIGNVIGIPELGQSRYIRNITGVCSISDIFKVGYVAQGVASVNQRYAAQFSNVEQLTDISQSYFKNINNSLNISSELGVMGPLLLSAATNIAGSGNFLANAPAISATNITQTIGLVNGTFGRGGSIANINNLLNPQAALRNIVGGAVGNLAGGLASGLTGGVENALNGITNQLGAGVQGAVGNLLKSSPLGGALAAFGALGGVAAAVQVSQTGGFAIGSFMSEVLTGTRIKTAQIANNPMLQPPSYAGKAFFGEAPVALPAIDQVFCKSVGAFGTSSGGGGSSSFGFQNFASMGGGLPVQSLVSKMITGSFDVPDPTTFFGAQVKETISNVCSSLNVKALATIEPRRSDNSIPFMVSLSAGIVSEKFSPFGSTPFTSGWKLAASAANDIQKVNPQFLETCRTSL